MHKSAVNTQVTLQIPTPTYLKSWIPVSVDSDMYLTLIGVYRTHIVSDIRDTELNWHIPAS